ncbi:UNVERIFIED_CONTAM: hypothetical protein NY100_04870 [Prevotella sp. 15_C9]
MYASDKLLSYQSANNRSLPTHGTLMFHPWNVRIPREGHFRSARGNIIARAIFDEAA